MFVSVVNIMGIFILGSMCALDGDVFIQPHVPGAYPHEKEPQNAL